MFGGTGEHHQYYMSDSPQDPKELAIQTLADNLPVNAREAQEQADAIMGLFGVNPVNTAFEKSNWTIEEEVKILVDIARGQCDPILGYDEPPSFMERRLAVKELRQIAKDAIEANGGIVKATSTRRILDEDGNQIDQHIESMRMNVMPRLKKTTELLNEGLATKETIDHNSSGGN